MQKKKLIVCAAFFFIALFFSGRELFLRFVDFSDLSYTLIYKELYDINEEKDKIIYLELNQYNFGNAEVEYLNLVNENLTNISPLQEGKIIIKKKNDSLSILEYVLSVDQSPQEIMTQKIKKRFENGRITEIQIDKNQHQNYYSLEKFYYKDDRLVEGKKFLLNENIDYDSIIDTIGANYLDYDKYSGREILHITTTKEAYFETPYGDKIILNTKDSSVSRFHYDEIDRLNKLNFESFKIDNDENEKKRIMLHKNADYKFSYSNGEKNPLDASIYVHSVKIGSFNKKKDSDTTIIHLSLGKREYKLRKEFLGNKLKKQNFVFYQGKNIYRINVEIEYNEHGDIQFYHKLDAPYIRNSSGEMIDSSMMDEAYFNVVYDKSRRPLEIVHKRIQGPMQNLGTFTIEIYKYVYK